MKRVKKEMLIVLVLILIASAVAVILNRLLAGIYCMAAGTVIFLFTWFVPEIKLSRRWQKELFLVINACLGYVLVELATGNLLTVTWGNALINVLFIYVFQKLLETIFCHYTISALLTLVVCLFIGIAEYYIMTFRGAPIVPWDLMVLSTAATVFGDYVFHYPKEIYLCVMVFVAFMAFVLKVHFRENQRSFVCRVQNGIITLVGVLFLLFGVYPHLNTGMWDMVDVYKQQGFIASFVGNLVYMGNTPPDEYDEDYAMEFLENYPTISSQADVQAQNVIVVMLESHTDFRLINDELVSDEYMPFWDSLSENTIKGTLHVPIFGAGTCDSEFEMLTGISTKYTGAYPYVIKVNYPTASIAKVLQDEGFDTVAYHPFYEENWRRRWVYPLFGFQKFFGISSSYDIEYIRWKMRDDCNFKNVMIDHERNTSDKYFMFNITMQNHGGYSEPSDDFVKTVDLSHLGSFHDAETFLSLMKMTDKAIAEFISYYEEIEEPTLICFFGDHQPKVENAYYEMLFGKSLDSLTQEEQLQRYQTPVMIWANYDLPEENLGDISVNYLSPLIMQYAGYDMSAFQSFLMELYKSYPVLTKNVIMDSTGHILTEQEAAESKLLKDYEMLCYYLMQGNME